MPYYAHHESGCVFWSEEPTEGDGLLVELDYEQACEWALRYGVEQPPAPVVQISTPVGGNKMSLETAIEKLADAILAHANAMVGVAIHDKAREVAETVAATKRGPGRPRKTEPTEQPPADAPPASPEAPAATDAGGPAADPAPVAAPSPAAPAQPQAGSPMAAAEVPKEAVQRALIKFVQDAEKRKPGYGRHTATAMCEKYGSKNVTGIAPGNYAALLADIEAAQAKVDSGEFAA